MVAERVTPIAGDVGTDGLALDDAGRATLASCDVVIHSAATVSFDSPLDSAVEVNLLGPTPHRAGAPRPRRHPPPRLGLHVLRRRAPTRRGTGDPGAREPVLRRRRLAQRGRGRPPGPHRRRGRQPSARRAHPVPQGGPHTRSVPRACLRWPPRPSSGEPPGSRTRWSRPVEPAPPRSAGPTPTPTPRPSASGPCCRTGATCRSRSCGRRSSSRRCMEPFPGWIRGFRMAEPVIISYARGLLKEFPGVPEGTVDVIPVDLVVAAIIDAAAGPRPRRAGHHPGGLGLRQPSALPAPRRHGADVLHRAPDLRRRGPADHRARVVVPGPRAGAAPARAGQVRHRAGRADAAVAPPPRQAGRLGRHPRGEAGGRRAGPRLRRALRRLRRVRGDLRRRQPPRSLGSPRPRGPGHLLLRPARRSTGATTPRRCTSPRWWSTPACAPRPAGGVGEKREDRLRRQVLDPARHFAAFDLENTLIASNVVASYSWLATRRLPQEDRVRFVLQTLREAPALLALDKRDRSDFLRHFYRRYEGADIAQLEADAVEMFSDLILTKSFPAAIRRVREHRRARAPHGPHHRCPRPRHRAAATALRRHRGPVPRPPGRRHLPR